MIHSTPPPQPAQVSRALSVNYSRLIRVTQTGYAVEHKIKQTRSDFRRDGDKRRDRFFVAYAVSDTEATGPAAFSLLPRRDLSSQWKSHPITRA
jgi:hypothetical protein